ncbi:MAG: cytochrome c [Steroidobacteraceae bacterium]
MTVIRLAVIGASLALIVLVGCSSKEASAPAAPASTAAALPAGPRADASILDLMLDPIAANADVLWNAVGTVSTPTGTKDLAPSTDAEWAAVRQKAVGLMEGADLLMVEGRVVAHPDQKYKDPPGPGDLTPAQAQAAIDKDRMAFNAFAASLKAAGGAIVAAIDKRDLEAYQTAGGTLDEVCESCHKRFWYPEGAKTPGP